MSRNPAEVSVGAAVTLSCELLDSPVTWYKDGKLICRNDLRLLCLNDNESTLTIYNVSKTDAGTYTCEGGPERTKVYTLNVICKLNALPCSHM